MPVLPPTAASPVDIVNVFLNAARTRLNDRLDTLVAVGGKVLQNNQAFSQQCVNDAWRKFQEKATDLGSTIFTDEKILTALPVVASLDPASQTYLNWTEFYDGANLWVGTWLLPFAAVQPIKIWERWTGQNADFGRPMELFMGGLPTTQKGPANRFWEWRNNAVYMPGSTMSMDLRIRFMQYLPDFTDIGTVRWYQQPVPVVRCLEPFSLFIAAEFELSRGDRDASAEFLELAEEATDRWINREIKAKAHTNIRRQARSGRAHRGSCWY